MAPIVLHGADWVAPGMSYKRFREQGLSFAIRYAVPSIAGKMIDLREVAQAHAAGVDIVLVYETSGATWEGGYSAGYADGVAAYAALRSLGAPYTAACYHAVDSPVPDAQMPVCRAWLDGVIHGMSRYRTGVYGEYSVVEMAASSFPHALRWQTKAWSGGSISPKADILQLGSNSLFGINVDIDVAYTSHIGQWYANPVQQPPSLTGEDMISGQIPSHAVTGVAVPEGSATKVLLYADTGLMGDEAQKVRVAVWSKAKRYSQITEVTINAADPIPVSFLEHDVMAVSFSRGETDGLHDVSFVIA